MQEAPLGYAVIDVETTGLYNNDRIIEISVVLLDHEYKLVGEYDTLVDPSRDLGPTQIHGITPSMLSMAPTFQEIAGVLARQIQNRTLVAHNIGFETRMLANEFQRLGAFLDTGNGICTLRHTREKLPLACQTHGVQPPRHHHALSDARATADLLRKLCPNDFVCPMFVSELDAPVSLRTHRRGAVGDEIVLDRLLSRMTYAGIDPAHLAYVDLLDWVLDDFVISDEERIQLESLAEDLQLTPAQLRLAHEEYFRGIVRGAEKDGVITDEEHRCLMMVANALQLPVEWVPASTGTNDASAEIPAGASICFTGSFIDCNGDPISKRELQDLAVSAGFKVVPSVTKAKCDVVVAVDASSSSGKAKKARDYGKPVIGADRFLTLV